jgi:hypothetical protein
MLQTHGEWCEEFRRLTDLAAREEVRPLDCQGWFDPGFGLPPANRFEFGDVRVRLQDRIVVVEVEREAGGHTNLLKYWPLSEVVTVPILLLHVFATGAASNYLSHVRLWEFAWDKMKGDVWRRHPATLFARIVQVADGNECAAQAAREAFRACLKEPLECVQASVFGYRLQGRPDPSL